MYGQNNYYPGYQPYYAPNGAMPDMLNQYKGQYQPMGQYQSTAQYQPATQQGAQNMQNTPSAPNMMPQPTSDLIWVLNEMEATAFPVVANNRVTLWDKNKDTVYIKSVDAQGVPSMRILDYVERGAEGNKKPTEHVCDCASKFVPIETFKALVDRTDLIAAKVDSLSASAKAKSKAKEETDNG